MCEIMTWSDDKTKSIHKSISTRLRLRALESKTKIPITIVKAQMPSPPNQKSRTRDNEHNGIWNHRKLGCFIGLFQLPIKKTPKAPHYWFPCEGNPPATDGFPSSVMQKAFPWHGVFMLRDRAWRWEPIRLYWHVVWRRCQSRDFVHVSWEASNAKHFNMIVVKCTLSQTSKIVLYDSI